MAPALVVGVGNRLRNDDGIGAVVAEQVAIAPGGPVDVRFHAGDPAALVELWHGADTVVVVDALRSGQEPGTVHHLVIDGGLGDAGATVPVRWHGVSSHGECVAVAVELARALDRMPRHLVLVGVEVADTGFGETLSPPVTAAVPDAVAAVREALSAARRAPGPPAPAGRARRPPTR